MKNVKNIVFLLLIIVLLCIVIFAMDNDEYKGNRNNINSVYINQIDKIAK